MAKDIRVTPESLMAQSQQLATAQTDFESLFSSLTNVLSNLNNEWSAVIARNFAGKIESAQKACSGIVEMMGNGSNAAKLSSLILAGGGGNTINGTLDKLMQYAEKSTFKSIDDVVKDIMTGDDASILSNILGKNYSTEDVKNLMVNIKNKDYQGIMDIVYEKGKDLVASAMTYGSDGGWVDTVNKCLGEVGIKSPLSNLNGNFYKNWIFGTIEKAGEAYANQQAGNYKETLYNCAEGLWNLSGGGAALKTVGDATYKAVSSIPYIGDHYAQKGATDALSMFEVAYSDVAEMISGDSETADYYRHYYDNHGGAVRGVVDGFAEIGSFIKDCTQNKELLSAFTHNIFG